MKKLIAILVVCAVAGVAFAAPAKKAAKTAKKAPAKAEFVIIESDEYKAGQEDPQLTAGIAQFLEAEPAVTKVSYKDAVSNEKLAGLDYSFLPLYLIKKTDAIRAKLEKHLQYGYAQENADYIILPHQTRQGVFNNKTAKPGVMEIFVMSQCPYGVMAENLVIQAQQDGKMPAGKDIRVRYIVNYSDKDGFSSLHGSGEWEENIRQLLIAKYYPEKFWKYLEIRNKDYRSSRWDKAMDEAGINSKKIMKKFDTEGVELLKAEAKYTQEYGINASPSFVWEGKVQLDFGSASEIEGFGFLNPNAAKSGAAAAAPAGSC
ncbi:hypothetical protein [Candidatus Avelusimicrobium fimicolum]|uniref:hypothetical protein n=1 Tax=Candidatus Avelusimicrobium fimicolum TaxID=3416216 RepID=UPI003D13CB4E